MPLTATVVIACSGIIEMGAQLIRVMRYKCKCGERMPHHAMFGNG